MTANLVGEILDTLKAMPEAEVRELHKQVSQVVSSVWTPQPGPQRDAFLSEADTLLFGGQAGGGKSDLLCGTALTTQRRSLLMRREYTSLGSLMDRVKEMIGDGRVRETSPPRAITEDDRQIVFGAVQNVGDERKFMGRARDFLGLDEAAQFAERQVRFLMGWTRTEIEGQRARNIFASNPPLDSTGDWMIPFFGPWLDITHPRPAKPGELRWFISGDDGKDIEVDGPTPVQRDGQKFIPSSRTFIPSAVGDNIYYVRSGYQRTLDALPVEIRSALRDGDFLSARADDEWQVIPTEWVLAAQARWVETPPEGVPMCAIASDVAQGGADETVISRRYDGWFDKLIVRPGKETPTGDEVAGLIIMHRTDDADVVIDVGGGYGGGAVMRLKDNGIKAHGYNGAAASAARTEDKQLGFKNKRAESWWRLREALNPSRPGGSNIALPDDPILRSDLTSPRWKLAKTEIQIEAKEDVKKRIGRSTDRGDAVVMAWDEGGRWATREREWRRAAGGARRAQVIRHRAHQKRR